VTVAVGGDGAWISVVDPMWGTMTPHAAPEGLIRRADPRQKDIDRGADPAPARST
jgi:hypothetical protein